MAKPNYSFEKRKKELERKKKKEEKLLRKADRTVNPEETADQDSAAGFPDPD